MHVLGGRVVLSVLLIAFLGLPLMGDAYFVQVAAFTLINVILATSLSIVLGLGGQISLAQSAFFAIGAYTSAIVTVRLGVSAWLGTPIAALVAAWAGLAVGLPALRVRGLYLGFLTLTPALAVPVLATNWSDLTGGSNGIVGIPRPGLPTFIDSDVGYYLLILLLATGVVVLTMRLADSTFGRILMACRDDLVAARTLGFEPSHYMMAAFVLSAALAGVAGALYAHLIGTIDPGAFSPSVAIQVLIMVIVGGRRRVEGAVIGAVVLSLLPEILRFSPFFWQLVLGLCLLASAIVFPDGLLSPLSRSRRFSSRAVSGGKTVVRISEDRAPASELPNGASRTDVTQDIHHPDNMLLRVEDLTVGFGGAVALSGVSLEVRTGRAYGLVGENGAGKTVLLNALCRLLKPGSGRVLLDGRTLSRTRAAGMAALGVGRTFQEPRVFGSLSAGENILLARQPRSLLKNLLRCLTSSLGHLSISDLQKVDNRVESLHIAIIAGRKAGDLSFGQRKLLQLATVTDSHPRLLLLDEPTTGLSPDQVACIERVVNEYRGDKARACLIVEHDKDLLGRCCDEVFALEEGRLVSTTSSHVNGTRVYRDAVGQVNA